MKYFIEELHTKKEWVYKRSHTILLGIIFTFILFIGAITAIIIGIILRIANSPASPVFLLFSLFLDFFIAFTVIEWLGKGWQIYRRQFAAVITKKKISATMDGFGSQIIRIPRK